MDRRGNKPLHRDYDYALREIKAGNAENEDWWYIMDIALLDDLGNGPIHRAWAIAAFRNFEYGVTGEGVVMPEFKEALGDLLGVGNT